jgi:hypothetical protein
MSQVELDDIDEEVVVNVDVDSDDPTSMDSEDTLTPILDQEISGFSERLLDLGIFPVGSTDITINVTVNSGSDTTIEHDFSLTFTEEQHLAIFRNTVDEIISTVKEKGDSLTKEDFNYFGDSITTGIIVLGDSLNVHSEISRKLEYLLESSVLSANKNFFSCVMRVLMSNKKDSINIRSAFGLGCLFNVLSKGLSPSPAKTITRPITVSPSVVDPTV